MNTWLRLNHVNILATMCPVDLIGYKHFGIRGQLNALHPKDTRLETIIVSCLNHER